MNQRILDGEALGPDTPVISPFKRYPRYRGANKGKRFAETHTITTEIRKTLRPRFKWRPYVFRAFFDTELRIASDSYSVLKKADIKDRKRVKPKYKPMYTKRIDKTTEILSLIAKAKRLHKQLGGRVA